jgi:hypothetical protein
MEILLIIMLMPLALAIGAGILRVLLEPGVWLLLFGLFAYVVIANMVN